MSCKSFYYDKLFIFSFYSSLVFTRLDTTRERVFSMMTRNETFAVQYVVSDIIFSSDSSDFVIFKAKNLIFDDGYEKELAEYIIKGDFKNISKGDSLKSNCEWVLDKKYGWQLLSLASFVVIPSNVRGIKRFLKKFIKGIGSVTVDKILKAYGVNTLDKIREDVSALTNIEGIGKKKAQSIREQILKYDGIEKLSLYLFQHNVTNFNDIVQIYEAGEDNALDKIKANPYCICDMLSISKFPLADTIALNSDFPCDSVCRVSKIILFYLSSISYMGGHMFELESVMVDKILYFLNKMRISTEGITSESFSDAINHLVSTDQIKVESSFIDDEFTTDSNNRLIYLSSMYTIESGIARLVKKILAKNGTNKKIKFNYDKFFKKYSASTGVISDKIQESAVINALENTFSILTGGPGTGKTQTVKEILDALLYRNKKINIALCSPTGRAAKRMSELTGYEACTIHRLLNLTPNENNFSVEADLSDVDYIICDEASMIDAPLFYKLLSAVDEFDISLCLVGDKDQLPPVGPGLPFKDLIESNEVPITILQNLFRQAKNSQINTNAKKILLGETKLGTGGLEFDSNKQDFFFFVTKDIEKIHNLIIKSIDNLIKLGTNPDDIVVLSPMMKSPVGSLYINNIIQQYLNPKSSSKIEYHTKLYTLREGDRVMQTENNYNLQVYNGDIGKIIKIDNEEEEITVSFEDYDSPNAQKEVVYPFIHANELVLSYAITIHKAQGSEFKCVIMPLNPVLVNLSRNIIYTCITRAKQRFIFIGDPQSLSSGIRKTDNMHRNTLLKARLQSDLSFKNSEKRIDNNKINYTQTSLFTFERSCLNA